MILCCGEALIDMVPFAEGFKPCPGGSPLNTAVGIIRLGVEVGFLGRLSKDFFGDMLVKTLADNGVKTNLIVRSEQFSTLAFVQLAEGEEPRYAFFTEGAADRSLLPSDVPSVLPKEIACLAFGSISMTMEPTASTIEALVKREGAARVISIDPNIRPLMIKDKAAYLKRFDSWLASCTIVKISGADIDYLYPDLDHKKAVEHLLSLGPKLVIMTLGGEGAMAVLKKTDGSRLEVRVPVKKVKVIDTIGAGDTFHAAFLAWLEQNQKMSQTAIAALTQTELTQALAYANLAAALVCTKQGAQPPTKAEMEQNK